MTQLNPLTEQLARQQIEDRLADARRVRFPGVRRPRGRHAFAQRLHRLADALDG